MKNLIYQGVSCEYIKIDEAIEFFCVRCNRRKISRKYAKVIINGEEKKLCNACYGTLLAKK